MKLHLKASLFLFVLLPFSLSSQAQVYMGGSGVISQFGPSALAEYRGFGAIIQRQIYLKESKFSLTPTLQGSLLTDKQYAEFLPEFYTSISMATHLNYDIIGSKKFRVTPFAGPTVIWISGLQGGGLAFDSTPVNFYRLGLETGLSLSYVYSDKFSVKLIPLTYTWGTKNFVQGNVLSLLFQIM